MERSKRSDYKNEGGEGPEREEADELLSNKIVEMNTTAGNAREIEEDLSEGKTGPTNRREKFLLSICVIFGVAMSWACATQFRKSTMVIDPSHFYAPYAMVWFSTSFMLLCYPLFLLYALASGKEMRAEHIDSIKIFDRQKHPTGKFIFSTFLWRELLFLGLWTSTNYAYAQSLGLISASAASSIMSANSAAVCVLGWALLKEPFNALKTLAVLLAIIGVFVVSMDSEFAGSPLGIALVVVSAGCAALYKVFFKLLHGSASLGRVSLFMSGLGLVNLTLNAIPTVVLVYFELDRIEWSYIPWWPLLGSAILGLVFNFLVNFGILLLDPLVISIGMIFGIPLSAGIDMFFRSMRASLKFLAGSALITVSFILIAFPIANALRRCCHCSNKNSPSNPCEIQVAEAGGDAKNEMERI